MFLPSDWCWWFGVYMIIFAYMKYTVIPNRFGQMLFNTNRVSLMQDVCVLVRPFTHGRALKTENRWYTMNTNETFSVCKTVFSTVIVKKAQMTQVCMI